MPSALNEAVFDRRQVLQTNWPLSFAYIIGECGHLSSFYPPRQTKSCKKSARKGCWKGLTLPAVSITSWHNSSSTVWRYKAMRITVWDYECEDRKAKTALEALVKGELAAMERQVQMEDPWHCKRLRHQRHCAAPLPLWISSGSSLHISCMHTRLPSFGAANFSCALDITFSKYPWDQVFTSLAS